MNRDQIRELALALLIGAVLIVWASRANAQVQTFELNRPMEAQFMACMGKEVPAAVHERMAAQDLAGAAQLAQAAMAAGHCGTITAIVQFRRQVHKVEAKDGTVYAVYEAALIVGGLEGAVVYVPMENMLHIPVRA